MQITFWQSLIIAIWIWLIHSRILGGATVTLRFSPLMTGLVVGVVMGDIYNAMIATAIIQLVFMGTFAPGGSMPVEPAIAAAIGVPITLVAGGTAYQALIIAIPAGIMGAYLQQIRFVLNVPVTHYVDRAAEDLNERKIAIGGLLLPTLIAFALFVPFIFATLFFGAEHAASLIETLEEIGALQVLSTIAAGLPAIGIATTIYVIGKKSYLVFFLIAFFLNTIFRYNELTVTMLTWAIVGSLMAFIFVLSKTDKSTVVSETSKLSSLDDDDDF